MKLTMNWNNCLACTLLCMLTCTTIALRQDKLAKNNKAGVPSSQQSDSLPTKERVIQVVCKVTPEQLKVKHWGMTYTPDEFGLEINKKTVFSSTKNTGATQTTTPATITVANNRIACDYSYSFACAWGERKGKKRAYFEIPDNVKSIEVSFSFTDDKRVLIPQAHALGAIETIY